MAVARKPKGFGQNPPGKILKVMSIYLAKITANSETSTF